MFVYRQPVELFDGLTPLHDWVGGQHPSRAAIALRAALALADAAEQVGWPGDKRHLPMVGGLLSAYAQGAQPRTSERTHAGSLR